MVASALSRGSWSCFVSAFARMISALRSDAVSGSLLIGAAVVALVWANSPLSDAYTSLGSFTFGPAWLHLDLPMRAWAADGLLALFFFIVGNELKQELVHGELRHPVVILCLLCP
jgi:NhaA family Na+:H+ antiporter